MILGVPKESRHLENRVAMTPDLVPKLIQAGFDVEVQSGAGDDAGFSDNGYSQKGARLVADTVGEADVVLIVGPPTPDAILRMKTGSALIGFLNADRSPGILAPLAARCITAFAMELIPRIARAQSMDALSAMSTVSGYKAVLLAADHLPRFFPLLMTAAGTIPAARVLVIGAGVSGLEAMGTAKRLGAMVEAYDIRSGAKEEVESVGGKFVSGDLPKVVASSDVIITAAFARGREAPVLVTEEMVRSMRPGSVIVDLAAEQGGNCALTEAGTRVTKHKVTILGPINLPGSMPLHASELYARTATNFLLHVFRNSRLTLDLEDEIVRSTLVAHQGSITVAHGHKP
jgi:NAD(P) transhydrogenase subunit alpha